MTEGSEAGSEYSLDRDEIIIGRQPSVEVCLNEPDVSRAHARISRDKNGYYLEDLGSSNGTYLNGLRLNGRIELADRDRIVVGSNTFIVELLGANDQDLDIQAELAVKTTNHKIYLRDASTKLQLMLEIAQELGHSLDLDELLPRLLDRLLVLFPQADRGFVLLAENDNFILRAIQSRPQFADREESYSRSIVRRVLTEGVGISATEQSNLPTQTIQALGIRSFLCVPLKNQGGASFGVLQLDAFRIPQAFTEEDLHILTAVALQASVVLENAALHGEIVRQERVKRDLDLARLSKMVAGVAHEINNPLAVIANNTTVLERDVDALRQILELYQQSEKELSAHQPELFTEIQARGEEIDLPYTLENLDRLFRRSHEGLKRIERIVDDLRSFARLDQSEVDWIDVNLGIESTVNTIHSLAEEKGILLKLELGDLPPLHCSPSKINQVVFNLLSNALDVCEKGDTITVRTAAASNEVEIHVIDTGPGMTPDVRDKVFDPFFTTKPFGKGVGLGLSLSYGVVRDHDGSIEVASEPGKGAHFLVRLPFNH